MQLIKCVISNALFFLKIDQFNSIMFMTIHT